MKRQSLLNGMVGLFVLVSFSAGVSGVEKIDRGLIALEREDGSVFLSWRLLDTDSEDIMFIIKRRSFESAAEASVLTRSWPCVTTNYIDQSAGKGNTYIYELYESSKKKWPGEIRKLGEIEIKPTGRPKP